MHNDEITKINPRDNVFLSRLATADPPATRIFFRGNLDAKTSELFANMPSVGIVGSRRPTPYGREICLDLAKDLAKAGVLIISGLALGIDGLAARGALDGSGPTIAILGTRISELYPKTNFALAREILDHHGLILSEYGPTDSVYPKTSFLARNRLISALSDILIVVEAGEQSGTLNTAAHALAQNRELMAVPGNITSPLSIGCNRLIAQGATPVLSVDDVLAKLRDIWQVRENNVKVIAKLDEILNKNRAKSGRSNQQKIDLRKSEILATDDANTKILKLLARGLTDGDEILRKSGLSITDYNTTLTFLEISGEVRPLGANRWSLK